MASSEGRRWGIFSALRAAFGPRHPRVTLALASSSADLGPAPVEVNAVWIDVPAVESPATPVLPGLGVVGAGRTIGNAVGTAAARKAAEKRFLGGGDPRARVAGRTRTEVRAPGLVIDSGTTIDPRHPAARKLFEDDGPSEGRAS